MTLIHPLKGCSMSLILRLFTTNTGSAEPKLPPLRLRLTGFPEGKTLHDSSQTFKVKQSRVKAVLSTWHTCPPAFLPQPYTSCLCHWDSSWYLCLLVLGTGPKEEAHSVAPTWGNPHVPSMCLAALKSPVPSRPRSWLSAVQFTDLSMAELDDWPPTVPTPCTGIKENPKIQILAVRAAEMQGKRGSCLPVGSQRVLEIKATWYKLLVRDHL